MESRNRYLKSFWLIVFVAILAQGHPAHAHPPTGIVVDKSGTVYFTDLETVWKLDTNNNLSVFRPGVSGRHVHELMIDNDANVYGADLKYENQKWLSNVWRMSPTGQLTHLIATTTNPPRGASILIDDAGNMYSAEQDNQTKRQTLILRRQPDGTVTTLAGGAYGQLDGKGLAARFSSIGGIAFGPDGNLYLTDGTTLRRVSMDGTATTLARDLAKRSAEDRPMLFGHNDGILTGLSLDRSGNIYVADLGNQRLLKISAAGVSEVVYRGEDPYFPNGVFVSATGELYVLEIGYQPQSTSLAPRVRKIAPNGKSSIIAVAGNQTQAETQHPGQFVLTNRSTRLPIRTLIVVSFGVAILGVIFIVWQRNRKRKHEASIR